eukprot:879235_1
MWWIPLYTSQYSQIWYNSMSNCENWISSSGSVRCGVDSVGCQNTPCVEIQSVDVANMGYPYFQRTTNITSYSSIQLQVSIGTYYTKKCSIFFQYDDEASSDTFNFLCGFNPVFTESFKHSNDKICNLPSAVGKSYLIIRLMNEGSYGFCYVDNVYLRGVHEGITTISPSANPYTVPSTSPSANPSVFPSVSPSADPSTFSSILPSINPSESPLTMMPTVDSDNNGEAEVIESTES